MAALSEPDVPNLLALNKVRPEQLDPILTEETGVWKRCLDWDFTTSADLVRRFVRMKALSGHALLLGRGPAGYSYFVVEDTKGLIGDLYILERVRCPDYENLLLEAALESLFATTPVKRVEAQLMTLQSPFSRELPRPEFLSVHPRNFMSANLDRLASLPPGPAAADIQIRRWANSAQEEAARIIASAYSGHIDSQINDQYRSMAGARRFLLNIVQYPGCGSFYAPGSWLARLPETGELCGLSLSSLVAPDVGHITQICTTPSVRGMGVGYELLRHSLNGLALKGCRKVSLTVTAANDEAIRLYEKVGFYTARTFAAYVWEGF